MNSLQFYVHDAREPIDVQADLVVTDPPFGINFTGTPTNYNRKPTVGQYTELANEDIPVIVKNIYNSLKPQGSFWLIMGWNNLSIWETECKKLFNQIGHVIWKYQFGVYTKRRPVTSHYHLLVYTKHKTIWKWNQQGYDEDVWTIKRDYQFNRIKYPNRLPERLVEEILKRSSDPGDLVLDPFCGSGTIPKVAYRMHRNAIGCDIQSNGDFWYNE